MAEAESFGYDQPQDKDVLGSEQGDQQPPTTYQAPGTLPPYTNEPTGFAPGVAGSYPYGGPAPPQQSFQSSSSTVVVTHQPQQQPLRGPRVWSSGVCGCFDDVGICLCGCFCQCCLAGQVASDMGESSCAPCCVPGWLIALRLKMRTQENIPGSLMDDCLTVCCCPTCALCQLAREVRFVRMRNEAATHQLGRY